MMLEKKDVGNILVIKPVAKAIDASNAALFRRQVLNWIQLGKNQVLLNLIEVEFIDSSGLGALIAIYKVLPNKSNLHLCCVQPRVSKIFEITGMHRLFHVFTTENEGLKYTIYFPQFS